MKIRKGDTVKISAGKDVGKTGKVLAVNPEKGRLIVEGANMFKKHKRAKTQGGKGEVISISRSMDMSNVLLVCPRCGQPTRVGYKIEAGKKLRTCKKCKSTI